MNSERHDLGSDGDGVSVTRLQEWFLLKGHRLYVTAVAVVVLFAVLAAVTRSSFTPLQNLTPVYYVFGGLISGNLTVVTVVVAINQLLLSREFYTPKELRSQMNGVQEYRSDVGKTLDEVPPASPSAFLRDLVEDTRQTAAVLNTALAAETTDETADEITPTVTEVIDHAEAVDSLIQQSESSTFEALSTTLTTDYAHHVHALERFEARRGDRLTDDVTDCLDDLVTRLEDIDVARQYFKTIYLQRELATLSQYLLYVGIGTLVVLVSGLLMLTDAAGASVTPSLRAALAGSVAVGLAPLSLLFAFLLRISTVSKRTAAILPFANE